MSETHDGLTFRDPVVKSKDPDTVMDYLKRIDQKLNEQKELLDELYEKLSEVLYNMGVE